MVLVEIYTTAYCPYCQWAKELLVRKGIEFKEIDVDGDRELRAVMTARADGRSTVPQIFIGATHIGAAMNSMPWITQVGSIRCCT